jgi:hypothetical protein
VSLGKKPKNRKHGSHRDSNNKICRNKILPRFSKNKKSCTKNN